MKSGLKKIKNIIMSKPNLDDLDVKSLLIKLSIPAIIAIFVNNLYNIMDSIFVGRGVGATAIGALTIAFPMQSLLNTFAMMIATGGMSILSRSLGQKNKDKASYAFGNSIMLTIIISLILTVTCLVFLRPILTVLGGKGVQLELAVDYMRIILIGTVFMGLAFIFSELIRAEGNSKQSMIIMAIGAVSNIILDYIFIIVLQGGVKGAALATTLAKLLSFVYAVVIILKGKSFLNIQLKHFVLKISLIKEMLSIGVSSLISQGSGSIGNAIANIVMINVGGEMLINAIGVFTRIHAIIFMPIFGVIQGMQPILGYNYGAKRIEKVKETAKLTLKYVFLIALMNTLVVLIFTKPFVGLFVADKDLVNYSVPYIRLALLFTCIGSWQCTGGTIFRAVGNAKKAFFFAVLRMLIIFTPLIIILGYLVGPLGCWLAFACGDLFSGLISKRYIDKFLNKL